MVEVGRGRLRGERGPRGKGRRTREEAKGRERMWRKGKVKGEGAAQEKGNTGEQAEKKGERQPKKTRSGELGEVGIWRTRKRA